MFVFPEAGTIAPAGAAGARECAPRGAKRTDAEAAAVFAPRRHAEGRNGRSAISDMHAVQAAVWRALHCINDDRMATLRLDDQGRNRSMNSICRAKA